MKQQFGGSWTEQKMRIVVDYARAYMTIMAKQSWIKTIYFDGFAGSGEISDPNDSTRRKGTALRILDLSDVKSFDIYYFVENNSKYADSLQKLIEQSFPTKSKNTFVSINDCNKKLKDLAHYLSRNRDSRALAFVDPYGMAVDWSSIECLKNLGVDLWILVPTGIGANRLLKKDGRISDGWYETLERFLGLSRLEIDKRFYRQQKIPTLFGDETKTTKESDSIQKLGDLYAKRLKEIFKYVSKPFVMRNSMNAIMYHFMMATNNATGVKIANDVIKPKYEDHGE